MDRLSRSDALKLVAFPSLASLVGGALPARAQSAATVRVAGGLNDSNAAASYAFERGFFKQAGLDVEIVPNVTNGSAVAAAIVSGTLEFGMINTVALASARENGVPFAWVAAGGAYLSQSPTAEMVVSKSSPIRTAKDMAGKTIAVTLLKQIAYVGWHAWLQRGGADTTSIKYVELPFSAMDAALLSGRIDACVIEEPVLSQTLASNGRVLAAGYDAIANRFGEGAWVCNSAFAAANPDTVRRFSRAMSLAADWANNNRPLTAQILEKYAKMTLPIGMHRCFYPPHLLESDFQPLVDAAAKYGVLKSSFRVGEVFAPGVS